MKIKPVILSLITLISVLFLTNCATILGPNVTAGIKLSETGDHAGALKHYEAIIEGGQANSKVYRLAYEAAFRAGKRVTAASYYDDALKAGYSADSLTSLAVELWYERALKVMGSDQWAEAKKAGEQLTRLAQGSSEDKFCTLILAGKKKYDRGAHKGLWDAINDYTKASILFPASGLPHYLSGQARYKNDRNDYDAALEDYYLAIELEPKGLFADRARADIKKIEATKSKMKAFWGK